MPRAQLRVPRAHATLPARNVEELPREVPAQAAPAGVAAAAEEEAAVADATGVA